jgi:hypothetical protein
MRLGYRAGYAIPLLLTCASLVGCATSIVPEPPNFNASPQIVAIYAVDSAFGTLPDVLVYSTAAADVGKISANPPPSYASYRVELDQPVAGETVANAASLVDPTVNPPVASFCSPLGTLATSPIQLVDVDAAARPISSSICYDPATPLGQHPHVLIIPGVGAVTDPAAKPLTCNTFAPENFRADPTSGTNVFSPNHKYGITIKPGAITNRANKGLSAPTGGGWVGDTFQFTTSGLKIMAAGFQDATTGFLVWLQKPEPGFEKDLAPCASNSTCPDANDNTVSRTYLQPADGGPFIIVLTEPVSDTTGVTLVRTGETGAGADPASIIGTGGNGFGDPRIIEVNTGDAFEFNTNYTVTVPGTLKAANTGDPIASGATYTFQTQPGTLKNLSTTPINGALAQATSTLPQVEFSLPVEADATTGTPTGTFTLTGPGATPVLLDSVTADPAANNQIVTLTPKAPLAPETTYTVSWSGVKVGPAPKALAGQAFPPGSFQFTTATFRMTRISASPSANPRTPNIDRTAAVDPVTVLKGGLLSVVFNSPPTPATVNTSSILVSELNGPTNTAVPLTGYSVTPVAPVAPATATTIFTIGFPAGYQPKYGQKYEVRTTQAITDSVSTKPLRAEGCTGTNCPDVKSFTTRKVGATVAVNPSDPTKGPPTGFTVTFTDPIDPTTIDTNTQFKLFERQNGVLNTTPVPINCAITSAAGVKTVVTCTAASSLGVAPKAYFATATFLQSAPVKVAPAVSTDPSAVFFGSVNTNILAPCPPTP